MKIRIGQLWKVPVFCLTAGFICFYANVFLVSRFAVVQLPDGSYGANGTLTVLFSAMFFILTMIAGQYILREMCVAERALSAAIQICLLLLLSSLPNTLLSSYATEWSRLVDRIILTFTDNVRAAAWINCFSPCLLIPKLNKK